MGQSASRARISLCEMERRVALQVWEGGEGRNFGWSNIVVFKDVKNLIVYTLRKWKNKDNTTCLANFPS